MKNATNRIAPAGPARAAALDRAELAAINATLEPELRDIASGWSTAKRLAMAETFRRWSDQLTGSASQLEPIEQMATPGHLIHN